MARKTALGWGRHPANLANKTGPKAAPKAVQANSTRSKIDVGADKEIPTAKTIKPAAAMRDINTDRTG